MSSWIERGLALGVLVGTLGAAGCGALTQRAATNVEPADAASDPARVSLVETEPVERALRLVADATPQRRAARGELLVDAWVHATLLDAIDPLAAAAWWDVLATAVETTPDAGDLDLRVAAAVRDDLSAGAAPADRVARAAALIAVDPDLAVPEEVWLRWADADPWIGPRARALALARAAAWLPAWSVRGTSGGGPMVQECSFLCEVDGPTSGDPRALAIAGGYRCPDADGAPDFDAVLDGVVPRTPGWPAWELLRRCGPDWHGFPVQLGTPLLLDEANWLDAVVLRNLAALSADVRADVEAGARSVASLAEPIAGLEARLAATAVPLGVTANVFLHDVRLDLPRGFDAFSADALPGFVAEPELRMLMVRSDGARVALRPHLRLDAESPIGVGFADAGGDWHLPGDRVVAFERPGAIAGAEVVNGRAPSLGEALDQLEVDLASAAWVGPAARELRAVSVFVDGNTYWGSLQPMLATLADRGYGPVVFHTWLGAHQTLGVSPLRLRFDAPDAAHLVVVRSDGFIVQPWSEDGLAEPTVISRAVPESLLALHRWLGEAVAPGGALADGLPVLLRVDDGSADAGMLVHLTSAIAWQRDLDGVATDRALLAAPLVLEGGAPTPLLADGVQVLVEVR